MTQTERDLWWEAREETRRRSQPNLVNQFVKMVTQSLPGQPTRTVFGALSLGRERAALVIDLNKYRPGRNLQAYVDAGADAFVLRMGGPTQWVEGDYRYQEDATWRPYMEAADKIGFADRVVGYWIQNAFEDWRLEGLASNVTLQLIKQWTGGGYMPPAFCSDHEVAHTWRGATKIQATNYNLVQSLAETTDKVYKQWKKPVSIYSARWFINQYAPLEHAIYFDNVNKPESLGGPGKQRGIWFAWLPQTFDKQYGNLEDTLGELITPTGTQMQNLLSVGSHSTADLWQYTFSLKITGDSQGVDASVSLGTKEQFFAQFGLKGVVTPPVEPPPPPATDLSEVLAQITALNTQYQNVAQKLSNLEERQANAGRELIG